VARLQRLHGIYNYACLVSIAGAFAGGLAICFSTTGLIGLSLVALIFAGLADLFDGFIARKLNLGAFEKAYGVQLDTVVDVLSFVAAPAVIGAALSGGDPLVITCIVIYMLAGLIRLAHFNTEMVGDQAPTDAHTGLPVTYAALVLPVLLVPMELLEGAAFQVALGAIYFSLAALFVSPFKMPKPRGVSYVIFPLLALVLIGFWITDAL
jgi:CDP-diacylglycerol--serine O-phosphatidyltransferase